MPPQSVDACLNDIVLQSSRNMMDAISKSDLAGLQIEAEHIERVSEILRNFLLYDHFDGWDNSALMDYWDVYKQTYIKRAKSNYVNSMYVAWEMLDKALEMYWYENEQTNE